MNYNTDEQYNSLMKDILDNGEWRDSGRTGIRMKSIGLQSMKHDLRDGFPILTSRQIPCKAAMVELEGFIKGITDKKWYQDRGCKFWDYWCSPLKVPYGTDEATKKAMFEERDLGCIYGYQWRRCNDPRAVVVDPELGSDDEDDEVCISKPIDQLQILVDKIRTKKYDRRWKVDAWNPMALHTMALVPCHTDFICYMSGCGTYLDLEFNMRSNDLPLGNPNNCIFYAALLTLLANEGGMIPRYLKHNMTDVHLYEDQIDTAFEQLKRPLQPVKPTFKLLDYKFDDIFNWTHECYKLDGYEHSGKLNYPRPAI
jgi:thymidylate synthase